MNNASRRTADEMIGHVTPRGAARRFAVEMGLSLNSPGTDRLARALTDTPKRDDGFDDDLYEWPPADGQVRTVRTACEDFERGQMERIDRERRDGCGGVEGMA